MSAKTALTIIHFSIYEKKPPPFIPPPAVDTGCLKKIDLSYEFQSSAEISLSDILSPACGGYWVAKKIYDHLKFLILIKLFLSDILSQAGAAHWMAKKN